MTDFMQFVSGVSDGLALEADIYDASGAVVLLWQAKTRSLVCPRPYRTKENFENAIERSGERGWPVHLRRTGGGTVPQGPGVLNLCLACDAPSGFHIEEGYDLITRIIRSVCERYGLDAHTGATPGSFCDGKWNLSLEGQKFVGTAQRWRSRKGQRRMLAHALILMDGSVNAGAKAVDAFHTDLGLDPVLAQVHTTLAEKLGSCMPELAAFAEQLHETASRELAAIA